MCLVVDTSVFSAVFNSEDQNHKEFKPVTKWITERKQKGFLVYGGSTYLSQLKRCPKYYRIIIELKNIGRAKTVNHKMVDEHQVIVNSLMNPNEHFDDTHIIAIFRVSRCQLFCSKDKSADKYITDRQFYLPGQRVPKIYREKSHTHLLCPRNIVDIKNLA
jgi:predicted nucleic acid-binding protein